MNRVPFLDRSPESIRPHSLATVLRAMLLAGLLAGGVLAGFHTVLTAPVIDQAAAFESMASGLDIDPLPLISRQQQKVDVVISALLYGLLVGIIFGGAYYLAQDGLPARRPLANAAILALAAYWAVGLFPFLKYPSDPPGIGLLSAMVEYRQALNLGFVLLSIAGGLVAANAAHYLEPRRLVVGGYLASAALLYLLMPANPDPVAIPMTIVTTFRLLSLAGLTIFWLVLGLSFGLLVEILEPDQPTRGLRRRVA